MPKKAVPNVLQQPINPRGNLWQQSTTRWKALLAYYDLKKSTPGWREELLLALARERFAGFKIMKQAPGKPRVVRSPETLWKLVLSIQGKADPLRHETVDGALAEFAKKTAERMTKEQIRPTTLAICRELTKDRQSPYYRVKLQALRSAFNQQAALMKQVNRYPDVANVRRKMLGEDIPLSNIDEFMLRLWIDGNPLTDYIAQE